jgi:hypothetical protein
MTRKAGRNDLRPMTAGHDTLTGSRTAWEQDPDQTARDLRERLAANTIKRKPTATMGSATNLSATAGKASGKDTRFNFKKIHWPLTRQGSGGSTDKRRTGVTKSRWDTAHSWIRSRVRSVKVPRLPKHRYRSWHWPSGHTTRFFQKGTKPQQSASTLGENLPEDALQDWLRQTQRRHQSESD